MEVKVTGTPEPTGGDCGERLSRSSRKSTASGGTEISLLHTLPDCAKHQLSAREPVLTGEDRLVAGARAALASEPRVAEARAGIRALPALWLLGSLGALASRCLALRVCV